VATLDELLDLGAAVGELLGVLFSGTDDAGRGFIGTLTDLTQRLTEFFKSAGWMRLKTARWSRCGIVRLIVNVVREVIDIFTDLDGWPVRRSHGSTSARPSEAGAAVGQCQARRLSGDHRSHPERIGAFVQSIPGRLSAALRPRSTRTTVIAFGSRRSLCSLPTCRGRRRIMRSHHHRNL
jgi:hypothetical protein